MNKAVQIEKAKKFLALHHDPKLLVLPNIWDPLGARLLTGLGFPAVATASSSVAYSLGYADGERITFDAMLEVVQRIAESVDVPVTADVERGYGESPEEIAANMRWVLEAGAVGINIEDSVVEGGALVPIEVQSDRIRAVRSMAEAETVPIVINARTDVFMSTNAGSNEERLEEAITRAKAYLAAGADCIYPITVGDLETLRAIQTEIQAPINVMAASGTAPMRELEKAGISRLSLGPNFLKASLTTMRRIALELRHYGSYDEFTHDVMSSDEIMTYVRTERMGR